MPENRAPDFEVEFDAIIEAIIAVDANATAVTEALKRERLLENMWNLIRSPAAVEVNDKAAHIIELADALNKVDPA